jgi:MFS family permease
VLFIVHERRTPYPMLPLYLFRSRNFAVGNISTLTMYAGLGAALFFVGLFLQQVAGYSALEAGAAFLPLTAMMFTLSRRWGKLADRFGPRWFMGVGPLIAGAGLALMGQLDSSADYWTELLPALIVFGLGLSMTVAPLTSTVLSAVDEKHSGVASGVNNAIARVAGLLAIAVLGAVVASRFGSVVDEKVAGRPLSPPAQAAVTEAKARSLSTAPADHVPPPQQAVVRAALEDASESAFQLGLWLGAGLVVVGGVVSLTGIQNPRRKVPCADCPGGALVGASEDLAHLPQVELPAAPAGASAGA